MQSLANKTVIVTGGSKGIGRVLAIRLAKENANVVITGRKKSELEKTKGEIVSLNSGKVISVNADVSVYEDVKKVMKETADNFSDIHYLINNAGIYPHKTLKDFKVEDWKQVVAINLFGAMMMC